MVIPAKITEGEEQSILFPAIPNLKAETRKKVVLRATSSAKVPVYYYVLEGPAIVQGPYLRLTKIPP